MLTQQELSAAIGSTAYGADGDKIGTVEHFFIDDRTGAPSWVAVTTGLFGTRHSVVPALDATFADGSLRLPVTRDAVKGAPDVDGAHLSPAEETALLRHYGLGPAAAGTQPPEPAPVWSPTDGGVAPVGAADEGGPAAPPTPSAVPPAQPTQQMPPIPPPPPPTPPAPPAGEFAGHRRDDGAMTRGEEQLRVGTEQVAATRARLVKYVVTEEVQITVPIRREEIRVEQVPLDAVDQGPGESLVPAGQASGGLPEEIVLHAERPVVSVEVVPVERVRLRTEVVEGQERVTEQVQREQIAVEQTPATGGRQG